MSIAALKARITEHLTPAPSGKPGVPTGIAALDGALPSRGLPRGRLTEIVGVGGWGGGKATVARRIVETALCGGEWVAYIDATRTLAPGDWAHLGMHEGLWMVRPQDPARAAWSADVILRSGAFALVVIDGAPPLPRAIAVRLTQLARESDAALLLVAADGAEARRASLLGGALRLRVARGRRRSRAAAAIAGAAAALPALQVTVEKGGINQRIEVQCAVGVARRLCTHSEIPDRRGVARREGRPPPEARTLARSRRCAEPDYGRESGAARAVRASRSRARALG
ncbi:MAG TPA: hypothetical protein VMM18_11775 [Gemmatimonadaceae bacterium]|nr:hypothetical protein [Gemmatimonadaceae bacterium]